MRNGIVWSVRSYDLVYGAEDEGGLSFQNTACKNLLDE